MLQLSLRVSQKCALLLLAALLCQPSSLGKCISLQITVRGKVIGTVTSNLTVVLEVSSATEGDFVTDLRQKFSIKKSGFYAVGWFNTTSNVVPTETCDRKPHAVLVKLVKGERVLDEQRLTIEKDFLRTKTGDYVLKKSLALRNPIDPSSTLQ